MAATSVTALGTAYTQAINSANKAKDGFLGHVKVCLSNRALFAGAAVDSAASAGKRSVSSVAYAVNLLLQFVFGASDLLKGDTSFSSSNVKASASDLWDTIKKALQDVSKVANSVIGVAAPELAAQLDTRIPRLFA